MDHFSILGLPQSFLLQPELLEKKYLQACKTHHPDFQQSQDNIRESLRQTALINQAYAVLKDPFNRADYCLKMLGGPTAEEHRTVPGDFLEQVMDWRTDLPIILENPEKTKQLLSELKQKLFFFEESLLKGFQKLESNKDGSSPGDFTALRVLLNCAKYLINLQDELMVAQGA